MSDRGERAQNKSLTLCIGSPSSFVGLQQHLDSPGTLQDWCRWTHASSGGIACANGIKATRKAAKSVNFIFLVAVGWKFRRSLCKDNGFSKLEQTGKTDVTYINSGENEEGSGSDISITELTTWHRICDALVMLLALYVSWYWLFANQSPFPPAKIAVYFGRKLERPLPEERTMIPAFKPLLTNFT